MIFTDWLILLRHYSYATRSCCRLLPSLSLIIALLIDLICLSPAYAQSSDTTNYSSTQFAATWQVFSGDDFYSGPYHDLDALLATQVGFDGFGKNLDRPQVRGSDYRESIIIVDGMVFSDEITSRPYYRINPGAVERIEVIKGGFSAEYGNARSGIIRVTTKEGGGSYAGTVDIRYSPPGLKHFGPMAYGGQSPIVIPFVEESAGAFTGNDFFEGWNSYAWEALKTKYVGEEHLLHYGKPYEAFALYLWRHRSPDNLKRLRELSDQGLVEVDLSKVADDDALFEYGNIPDWQGDLSLGGPIPYFRKVRFFFSHRQEQMEYALQTPHDTYREHLTTLKLTTHLTDAIKLNVNFLHGRQRGNDGREEPAVISAVPSNPFRAAHFPQAHGPEIFWAPHRLTPAVQTRTGLGFTLTHTLSPRTFYEVIYSQMSTDFETLNDWRNTYPLGNQEFPEVTGLHYGRIGTEAYLDAQVALGYYENWRDWAKIKIGGVWYDEAPQGLDLLTWTGESVIDYLGHNSNDKNESATRNYTLRASITSRINRSHKVKAGFELDRANIAEEYIQIIPIRGRGFYYDANARPWRGAFYVLDNYERGGVTANVGLRLDWLQRDKMITLDGRVEDKVNGPYSTYLKRAFDPGLDKLPWKSNTITRISPRLAINYALFNSGELFFNYGHFYEWPDGHNTYFYQRESGGYNLGIARLGNPRLRPPRTIAYELGYAQDLFNLLQLRLTGYYKETNDEYEPAQFYFSFEGDPLPYYRLKYLMDVNMGYRDIRGLEARLTLRPGPLLNIQASLDYQAVSKGRFGYETFFEDPERPPVPVSSDVYHAIPRPVGRLQLAMKTPLNFGPRLWGLYPLAGMNLNLLYTWRDGETFTWNPEGNPGVKDNLKWRPYQMTDLRFTKRLFKVGKVEPVLYVDVFNVFNHKNMQVPDGYIYDEKNVLTGVEGNWTWSGGSSSDWRWWHGEFLTYIESLKLDEGDRPGDYPHNGRKEYIQLPGFTPWTFLAKRDIFFGIRLSF